MTNDERVRPTWDGEAIAEAVGRELARRDDAVWMHEPSLEWLGTEARAAVERRRTSSDEELLHRGRMLRVRLLARQCGVGLLASAPQLVMPTRRGVPAQVLDEAIAAGAAARVDLSAAAGAGRALWDEPVEEWVALPAGVPAVRALALRIEGESMAPLLHTGDTVLVELDAPLARGRIVVARHRSVEDGYVCKRVERIGRREIVLASINAEHGSVVIPRDERLIVGTVRLAWRAGAK